MYTLVAAALMAAGLTNAVVIRPVANMYSRPSEDADVVSQAIYGANVGILERNNGWARIRTADDYTGWAQLAALRLAGPYAVSGRVAQVESLFAHIYREADVTRHAPLATVPYEARLEIAAVRDERWLEARLPDGGAGFVQRGDVVFDPPPLDIAATIELARRFLGLPYTWGGTSSYGFDCSGFVQMLCRRRGVLLPRDAAPQSRWEGLAAVEKQDLRPGDLLYFGSSPGKVTHTGMYIGGGRFINATTHERPTVRIDDLTDPHWTGLLVGCRRLK